MPPTPKTTVEKHVLIVDDDIDFADALEEILEPQGYHTRIAHDSESARRAVSEDHPQVVLIDVRLGLENGLELIPIIKGQSPESVCIIMTAYADTETAIAALKSGAYDFLRKPLRPTDITVMLERVFELMRLEEEKRDAIRQLAESEERIRNLVEGSIQGFLVHRDFKPIFVNRAFAEIHGFESPEQVLALDSVLPFVAPHHRERMVERAGQVMASETGGELYEYQGLTRDGSQIWLESSSRRVQWGDEPAVQTVAVDITNRKQAEWERNRLATAVEQAADSIFITDTEGVILYVNPAFERITGFSRKDALGQNPRILNSGRMDKSFFRDMWNTIKKGETWRGGYINKRKDGSFFNCRATTSTIRDAAGKITHYIEVQRDTTQEERLESQLRQAQKMEAIGVLAGGIAHDFNNLLVPILGFSELTMNRFDPDDESYEDLNQVRLAALRAKGLVEQILLFSRKEEDHRSGIDMTTVAKDVTRLLRSTLPKVIQLEEDIPTRPLYANADGAQMQQVLMNLGVNASQAMPRGGVFKISLSEVTLTDHPTYSKEAITGEFLALRVADSGEGMDATTLAHLFEPFYTTKDKTKGTGLGLSIVHGIVQRHGGYLEVSSEKGVGTTFTIYLPKVQIEDVPSSNEALAQWAGGMESILLVDDEEMICAWGSRFLGQLGYEVTAISRPVQAWNLVKENPDRFDMVITDYSMPMMSGCELAKKIRTVRPDMPIVLCTGYAQNIAADEFEHTGFAETLYKPLTNEELVAAVRQALDGSKLQS